GCVVYSERHDFAAPTYTSHSFTVIANRGCNPSYSGVMTVSIHGVVICSQKIPTPNIVNIPICVVINTVCCNFITITPNISRQVRMIPLHTRSDNSDGNTGGPSGEIPCGGR